MVGVIATLKIKEGTVSDFEAVANQLVEKVNANEKGAIYYDLYRQDETTYVFLERYTDSAAFEAHKVTEYYKSLGAQLGAFVTAAPDIKVLESV